MHLTSSLAVAALAASGQAFQIGGVDFFGKVTTTKAAVATPAGFGGFGGFGGGSGGKGGSPVKPTSAKAPSPPIATPPTTGTGHGGCPAVWTTISQALTSLFVSGGQCTDDARAAIRATFHDCFPSGGCDGSLAIPAELSRPENTPMTSTVNKLAALANQHGVTTADMLVFAGSHAVASCPGGPRVETLIGRKDASSPAPSGQLPSPTESAQGSISKFAAKGLSTTDLAALIGAHSTAKQFTVNPAKAGAPEDTTPGVWDVLYYSQTIAKTAPFTFVSDTNLVNQAQTGAVMKQFAKDKSGWDAAFASAMARMELLGGNKASMVDCTSALPNTLAAREAKARPINARA